MFSYEDLYELLRAEKLSTDLQPLRKEDLKKIADYLKMKENLLLSQEESVSLLSAQKRAKIQIELDNARRTLKDLYEKRERKVINRGVVSVRSGLGMRDTTNMLKHEQELYETIISLLSASSTSFFDNMLAISQEDRDPMKELHKLREMAGREIDDLTKPRDATIEFVEKLKVMFLEEAQEFYGEDLKSYGPYARNEVAEIPVKIANLLISQKKARLIENEIPKSDTNVLPNLQGTDRAQSISSETQAKTEGKETWA